MDEFERIARFLAPLATAAGAYGLRDDVASLSIPAGKQLVITQDTLVETIHFIGDEPPALLARKALRVNLSDLAAKGATPYGYLLSLSLPSRCDEGWVEAFAQGLAADQKTYGLSLLGGDSTGAPEHIALTITALGLAERTVRRDGAQVGDVLFVTGTIGDGYLGLKAARGDIESHAELLSRYHLPQPRVGFAQAIAAYATASLDVSDGLLQDACHLARESGILLEMRYEDIPLSDAASAYPQEHMALLSGGDDYEILFTAPASAEEALQQAAKGAGISLTRIGTCSEGQGVVLRQKGEKTIPLPRKLGWKHS